MDTTQQTATEIWDLLAQVNSKHIIVQNMGSHKMRVVTRKIHCDTDGFPFYHGRDGRRRLVGGKLITAEPKIIVFTVR